MISFKKTGLSRIVLILFVCILGLSTLAGVASADGTTYIVAASDSSADDKALADLVCDGTNDEVDIATARAAAATHSAGVLYKPGTYVIQAAVAGVDNIIESGSGYNTVWDASGLTAADIIIIGQGSAFSNIKVVGSPAAVLTKRIMLNTNAIADHIFIYNNAYGFECNGSNIQITNSMFEYIMSTDETAACIHAGTSSKHDIYIYNVTITNATRGIEIENGAYNVHGDTISVTNVTDFSTDAHTHDGLSGTHNVTYKNVVVTNSCGPSAVDCGASQYNLVDYPYDITFENYTINSLTYWEPIVANNVLLKNFTLNMNISANYLEVNKRSDNVTIDGLTAARVNSPAVLILGTEWPTNVTIKNCNLTADPNKTATSAMISLLNTSASFPGPVTIINNSFHAAKASTSILNTINNTYIINNTFDCVATVPTYGIWIGANNTWVEGNVFNVPTPSGYVIIARDGATNFTIIRNYAPVKSIWVRTTAISGTVHDNILPAITNDLGAACTAYSNYNASLLKFNTDKASIITFDHNRSTVNVQVNLTYAINYSLPISYATADGTALAGIDYTAQSGALTFWGETSKNVSIPLTYTHDPDKDVSFTMSVSNPGIVVLGTQTSTTIQILSGEDSAPVANFTATPTAGGSPLQVAFNGSISTGSTLSYAWSFGDLSENSTEANPEHTYTEAGTYTVILTVTNEAGSDSTTEEITVSAAASGSSFNIDWDMFGSVFTGVGSLAAPIITFVMNIFVLLFTFALIYFVLRYMGSILSVVLNAISRLF